MRNFYLLLPLIIILIFVGLLFVKIPAPSKIIKESYQLEIK